MRKPLKAILLAAGFGTRLRPLTYKIPKCLIKVSGLPILGHWLIKLEELGCESVLINTHYLSEQVEEFILGWKTNDMEIKIIHEKNILGTAGTLLNNIDFYTNSTGLLIHADNITTANLSEFIKAHLNRPKDCFLTMLTFNAKNPSQCGIVKINSIGKVISFVEKDANPPSNCANGALYAFDDHFLDFMKKLPKTTTDFSTQVIPKIIGKIYTWHTNDFYLDIGTKDALDFANKIWKTPKEVG